MVYGGFGPLLVSPDGAHVYVGSDVDDFGPGTPAIAIFSRNPVTGALTFVGAKFNGTGGLTILDSIRSMAMSPDGKNLYVGTRRITFARNSVSGDLTLADQLSGPGFSTEDFAITADGSFVYEVTGAGGQELRISSRNPSTGLLTTVQEETVTGRSGGIALSADERRIYVVGGSQTQELVVFERDPDSGAVRRTAERFFGLAGSAPQEQEMRVAATPDGKHLIVSDHHSPVFVPLPSSGVLSVYLAEPQLSAFDADTSTLRPTKVLASDAKVAAGRAVVRTSESLVGTSLNGDNDQNDIVAQLFDVAGPTDSLIPLGVAARETAISDRVVAISVPEASENDTPRNGDGLADDDVLAVYVIGTAGPATFVNVAATKMVASGPDVVFLRPEAAEPVTATYCTNVGGGCDLNADGDALDEVVHVYHSDTGELENLGLAGGALLQAMVATELGEIATAGRLVAFGVQEAEQGAQNLNGDGDTADTVFARARSRYRQRRQ